MRLIHHHTLDPMPPATAVSTVGRCWQIAVGYVSRHEPQIIGEWIVETPFAHCFWHSYWFSVANLAAFVARGHAPLHRYVEDATHEFVVFALDPDTKRAPVLTGEMPKLLTPANFAAQFKAENDATAMSRVEGAIHLCLTGEISPDTDQSRQWQALFGDAMIRPEYRAR
jgi:hypothetical protein